jgi:hypothetical protein
MIELTKLCRLDKNLVHLILQMLSLLSKSTGRYFQSLDVSSLDWMRGPFVLSAFEPEEENELTDMRNDRRLKLKHSSTDMAQIRLSLWQENSIFIKKAIQALCLQYICVRLTSVL